MQRDKNLRNLSSDHHKALALARDIKKVCQDGLNDDELITRVKAIFKTELLPHFEIEEQAILPELTKVGEDVLVQRTLEDHKQLKYLVRHLGELDNLTKFAEKLKEHVRFEERELFEVCQSSLDQTALERISSYNHQNIKGVRPL